MTRYDKAFEEIIGIEGGLSLDPEDNGNWTGGKKGVGELKGTKYGISAASHPNLDIQNLTLEEAKRLYYAENWKPLRCDEIPSEDVAIELFEQSVNCGNGVGIKNLQKSLKYFFREYSGEIDGVFGPKTMEAVINCCRKDAERLFKVLNGYQFQHYAWILENKSSQRIYSRSWLSRVQFHS